LVIDSRAVSRRADILPSDPPLPSKSSAPQSTNDPSPVIEKMMNALWRWTRRPELPLYEDIGMGNGKAYPEVAVALTGAEQSLVRANAKGETIISVAVPVQRFRSVHGALLLSTPGGEIDAVIATERWAFIRIFLVSASVMLLLSLLLVSSIVNDVRRQPE
jgi:two-component system sensor histidine kinase ChvG